MSDAHQSYDTIIVGARVAGTAAAVLLARAGIRILLVDKAAFPADTISTHIVLSGGTRVLARMGVLDRLEEAGGVRYSKMRTLGPTFDYSAELESNTEDYRGLCLGRLKMDAAMLAIARSFDSVSVREQFRVTDLLIENGEVTGIRGEDATGVHEFHSTLAIGADGMRSAVAKIAHEKIGKDRGGVFRRKDV
ncbi:MAG TPA: FAD-dependent monooxygenase, partial [Candidatus Binataceae bacterium]